MRRRDRHELHRRAERLAYRAQRSRQGLRIRRRAFRVREIVPLRHARHRRDDSRRRRRSAAGPLRRARHAARRRRARIVPAAARHSTGRGVNPKEPPMTHASEIRSKLGHPVIDGDGHWMEPIPVFLDHLAEIGGAKAVDEMRRGWRRNDAWYRATPEERQANRMRRFIWWGVTANTRDKATALLPALLNERLPELGIDFAVMYPSFGLTLNAINDDELSRAACRAYNVMTAEMFKPYLDRF